MDLDELQQINLEQVKRKKNDDSKKQCGHFEKEIGNEFSSCDRQKLE